MSIVLNMKQPNEEYYESFLFSDVGDGSISAVSAVVTDEDGNTVTSTILDAAKTSNTDNVVNLWVRQGETHKTYKIEILVTTAAGEKFEKEAYLPVVEL